MRSPRNPPASDFLSSDQALGDRRADALTRRGQQPGRRSGRAGDHQSADSLDIFWLRDESLEATDNLPSLGVIAAEIVEDLEAALAEFTELAESLQGIGVDVPDA
jgi:hypothetical protein